MALPKLDNLSLRKPLSYDRKRHKFIYYNDLISGDEKIIFMDDLSIEEKKTLIIERIKQDPNYTIQSISGIAYSRDDIIQAIQTNDDIGKMTLEAETSMLNDLLKNIAMNLK